MKLLLNGPRGNEVISYLGELSLHLINACVSLKGRDGSESYLVAILPETVKVGNILVVCGFVVKTSTAVMSGSISIEINTQVENSIESLVAHLINEVKKSYKSDDVKILGLQIL